MNIEMCATDLGGVDEVLARDVKVKGPVGICVLFVSVF